MTLTPFISWTGHGGAAIAPPGIFTGATAHMFVFEADKRSTQALADKLLTPGGQERVRYRSRADAAFISFMHIDRCGSADAGGWTTGRECALWIPLSEEAAGGGERFVLWAPYVFIDYSLGMITGREVWGWPKTGAQITMPRDDPGRAPAFSCSTMIFRDPSAPNPGVIEPLLTVEGPAPAGRGELWTALEPLIEAMGRVLLPKGERGFARAGRFEPILSTVALKQFRHSEHTDQACYQAIVNSPCELTRFHAAGPLFGRRVLRIANCGSHQIATDFLGAAPFKVGATEVEIIFAAWLEFDFKALAGSVVAP